MNDPAGKTPGPPPAAAVAWPESGVDLDERYGRHPDQSRKVAYALAAALLIIGLVWVSWIALGSRYPVTSQLLSYTVTSDTSATAVVQIQHRSGSTATCQVQAQAPDHSVVGLASFTVAEGDAEVFVREVRVRTQRRATTVVLVGCTAPGQKRPH